MFQLIIYLELMDGIYILNFASSCLTFCHAFAKEIKKPSGVKHLMPVWALANCSRQLLIFHLPHWRCQSVSSLPLTARAAPKPQILVVCPEVCPVEQQSLERHLTRTEQPVLQQWSQWKKKQVSIFLPLIHVKIPRHTTSSCNEIYFYDFQL